MLEYLAARLTYLVVDEYEVVLVDEVFYVKEERCDQRYQRDESSEDQVIQKEHQKVSLMVAKIEMVFFFEQRMDDRVLLSSIVHFLADAAMYSVNRVNLPKAVGNEFR